MTLQVLNCQDLLLLFIRIVREGVNYFICYQIIEQLDEEEEKDNVLIKGRRHKKPVKNKKSGRLYEGKQAESKRVSLMDI